MKSVKRSLTVLAALLCAVTVSAQSAEEIVSNMEAAMSQHEKEGVVVTTDTKIPVVGTMSVKSYLLGDKMRLETKVMGVSILTWSDGVTTWVYNDKKNTIEIKDSDMAGSDDAGDTGMFSGITDVYDVSISKETDTAWYIQCKKSRNNKAKNAPKTMNLVVAKGTFYPLGLSAKASGVNMRMYDISFGVTEADVHFDINDYPDAKIVDKRKNP